MTDHKLNISVFHSCDEDAANDVKISVVAIILKNGRAKY
jgi:hypothetical protein